MALTTKSFTTLVSDAVAAVQGYAATALDLSIGSVLRVILESSSSSVLWLLGLILQLLETTRASSSEGPDLDSWMRDYNVTRLPAVAAEGQVTFSRFTATAQALVPVGTTVQTADGTQTYVVLADTNQSHYDATQNAYVLPASTTSITATVQAITAGSAGNAVVGAISVITTSLPGVDTVTNALSFVNGGDAESDPELRARFVAYLQSLSKATKGSIGYAITSIQEGLTYQLVENQNQDGSAHPGFFFAVVDDGSGSPSSNLLATVYSAIDAVRAFTVSFAVFPPTVETATVSLQIAVSSDYDKAVVGPLVQAAVVAYVNGLPLGTGLPLSRIAQVAYDSTEGITNVYGITINGVASDLAATPEDVIKAGLVSVS